MAAKSADSARSAAARSQSVAKTKKADAAAYASKPSLTKMTVSQATINKIKTDGMTAALKKVGSGKASATYVEGVKRMYGANRIVAAKKSSAAKSVQSGIVSGYGYKAPKSGGGKGMGAK